MVSIFDKAVLVLGVVSWTLMGVGCETKRSPLTDRQVDELLRIPAESTEATRELVEHDAKSREALISLQADVQKEFSEIGRRQDELERERRSLALHRHRDPIIATTIEITGLIVACLLPLVVVALLLWPREEQQDSEAVCDYLAQEVIAASESARVTHGASKHLTSPSRENPGA